MSEKTKRPMYEAHCAKKNCKDLLSWGRKQPELKTVKFDSAHAVRCTGIVTPNSGKEVDKMPFKIKMLCPILGKRVTWIATKRV